jgi:hypothetical protein
VALWRSESRAEPTKAARVVWSAPMGYEPTKAEPPVGNTGVEMTNVGLGWLQATVRSVKSADVSSLVTRAFGSEP